MRIIEGSGAGSPYAAFRDVTGEIPAESREQSKY